MRLKVAAVLLPILALSACTSNLDVPPPGPKALAMAQRRLVLSGFAQLRDALNRGACTAIYEEAAMAFQYQSETDWVRQCERLRARFGTWRSIEIESGDLDRAAPIAYIDGRARFAHGQPRLRAVWDVTGRRARLFFLLLGDGEQQIWAPPQRPFPWRFADPPPPKRRYEPA